MSILIEGMEMPKVAVRMEAVITILKDGTAQIAISPADDGIGYWKEYPLISVQPHGRLIDADALEVQDGWIRDSKYFAQESSHTHITFVYSEDIYNAPTVIPTDKDGGT